jgi:hypothetical protein
MTAWCARAWTLRFQGFCLGQDRHRDADGLTAIDYAMGRARIGFLQQRPEPRKDMAALLRELGATVESPDTPPWKPLSVPRITAVVPE